MTKDRISSADFELLAQINVFVSRAYVGFGLESEEFSNSVIASVENFREMYSRGESRSQIMKGMREGIRDALADGAEELSAQTMVEMSCRFYEEFDFQISELNSSWPDCTP